MRWFGEHWGAVFCDEHPRAETPVGRRCYQCHEAIEGGEAGFLIPGLDHAMEPFEAPYHHDCLLEHLGFPIAPESPGEPARCPECRAPLPWHRRTCEHAPHKRGRNS